MGAIMVTSLIRSNMILADRFDFIRNVMKEFAAGRHIFCDMGTVQILWFKFDINESMCLSKGLPIFLYYLFYFLG